MKNVTACKFCGQAFMVDGESESERMRAAIAICNCSEALAVQRKWRYINAAKIKLTEVFSFNPFGENTQIADEDECVQAIEEDFREIYTVFSGLLHFTNPNQHCRFWQD